MTRFTVASLARSTRLLIVLVVTLLASMEFLTSYAVGVALPDIQGGVAASFDEGSWILTAYNVCFLLGLVASNAFSDRIGSRNYVLAAASTFTLFAAGCGVSQTLPQLLVCRCVMGFAGGSFLTRAQTIIYRLYQGPERVKALTFFALCVVAGARTSGALIGGYLTEWFSWRAIFFLNLPFAITAIVILAICLPNLRLKHSLKKIDWPGLLFLAGWVAPIQIILSRGERNDWFADPMIRWLAVCASVCLILFILCELRPGERSPIITLRNYTHRNFVVGSLYVVVLGMILFGQLWAVPQFLRNVQHHSAWETGVLQTFNAAGFFVGLVAGSILMNRIGVKFALAAGAAIFCGGMLIWATRLSVGMSDAAMLLPLALTGVGAGWQLGPLSRLINGETPPELLGEGMELYLYQRQLAGSWGIAILTIMVDHRRSFWSERLGEHIDTYSSLLQEQLRLGAKALQGAGLTSSQADAVSLGIVHGRLLQQSVVNAFMETFYYQAALGAFALFLIFAFCYRRHVLAVVRWSSGLIRWTR